MVTINHRIGGRCNAAVDELAPYGASYHLTPGDNYINVSANGVAYGFASRRWIWSTIYAAIPPFPPAAAMVQEVVRLAGRRAFGGRWSLVDEEKSVEAGSNNLT